MKKLFIIGALAFASFSFANTKESAIVKDYKVIETKVISQQLPDQIDKKATLRMWYEVTFELPCGGGAMTVIFPSDNVGTWFAVDLMIAVQNGIEAGCNKKAELGLSLV